MKKVSVEKTKFSPITLGASGMSWRGVVCLGLALTLLPVLALPILVYSKIRNEPVNIFPFHIDAPKTEVIA